MDNAMKASDFNEEDYLTGRISFGLVSSRLLIQNRSLPRPDDVTTRGRMRRSSSVNPGERILFNTSSSHFDDRRIYSTLKPTSDHVTLGEGPTHKKQPPSAAEVRTRERDHQVQGTTKRTSHIELKTSSSGDRLVPCPRGTPVVNSDRSVSTRRSVDFGQITHQNFANDGQRTEANIEEFKVRACAVNHWSTDYGVDGKKSHVRHRRDDERQIRQKKGDDERQVTQRQSNADRQVTQKHGNDYRQVTQQPGNDDRQLGQRQHDDNRQVTQRQGNDDRQVRQKHGNDDRHIRQRQRDDNRQVAQMQGQDERHEVKNRGHRIESGVADKQLPSFAAEDTNESNEANERPNQTNNESDKVYNYLFYIGNRIPSKSFRKLSLSVDNRAAPRQTAASS